jgi:DNA-binding IscR family transcriptional regulator
MNNISLGILRLLDEHKEIKGTGALAEMLNAKRHYVFTNAIMLQKYGMIEIVPGGKGQGNKTIYRDAGMLKVKNAGTRS